MYVVPATNQGDRFEFLFLHTMINYKLRLHDVEAHLQQDNPARNILSGDLIFVQVDVLLGAQGRAATADEVILEDKVENAADLPQSDILLVKNSGVTG